jgi:hypothetical protein
MATHSEHANMGLPKLLNLHCIQWAADKQPLLQGANLIQQFPAAAPNEQ